MKLIMKVLHGQIGSIGCGLSQIGMWTYYYKVIRVFPPYTQPILQYSLLCLYIISTTHLASVHCCIACKQIHQLNQQLQSNWFKNSSSQSPALTDEPRCGELYRQIHIKCAGLACWLSLCMQEPKGFRPCLLTFSTAATQEMAKNKTKRVLGIIFQLVGGAGPAGKTRSGPAELLINSHVIE